MDQQYDIFISYSRSDYVDSKKNVIPGNVVSKVKQALYDAGYSFWFDEEGIDYGEGWAGKITKSIRASKILIFISSKNANNSRFTKKEISIAQQYNKPIIPFRLDMSPYDEDVSFYLADIQYVAYCDNPNDAIAKLMEAVNKHSERLRKEESIREQQEKEERLFSEISISADTLNNEKRKIEIERRRLLLRAEEIKDKSKRTAIIATLGPHNSEKKRCKDIDLKKICIGLIVGIVIGALGMAFLNKSNQESVAYFPAAGDTTYIVKDSTIVIDFGPESMRCYKYSGPIKVSTKLPEGYGIAHFEKWGSIPASDYKGIFVNGLCDDPGDASLVFTEGIGIYIGSFSKGYYVEGKFTDSNGSYYIGSYKNSEPWDGISYDRNGNKKITIKGGKPI